MQETRTPHIQNKTNRSIRATYLIWWSSTRIAFLWSTHISFLRSNHASQAAVLLYGGDATLLLSNSAKDHGGQAFTDIKTSGWDAKNPRPIGFTIHTIHRFCLWHVNTSTIQMVPLTFAGYTFFSFLIKRCTDKCSRSLVFRSLSLRFWSPISLTAHLCLCNRCFPLPHVLLLRSLQKVSETENRQKPSSLERGEREMHLYTLTSSPTRGLKLWTGLEESVTSLNSYKIPADRNPGFKLSSNFSYQREGYGWLWECLFPIYGSSNQTFNKIHWRLKWNRLKI